MCGICGIVNFEQRAVSLETLKKMNEAHILRGPDEEGILIKNNAGFGFRRLSVIDLRTGGQPIHNEDEEIWVMCNGEIYNFLELREELRNKSHRFYTESDAETIVHLYEELGEDFLDKLDGMFAVAVWDNRRQKLVLARDRMGEKPLYYAALPDKLIFASEIKSILRSPDISRSLDAEAANKYFTYEFIPAPKTPFPQIKKLLPGHILSLDKKKVSIKKYWDIKFSPGGEKFSGDEEDAALQLDVLLKESVRKRLISDVPLGAFLSGGIDSSYIVSLMTDICPCKVKTFNIAFEDSSFDESRYAKEVAGYLNTEHFEGVLTPKQLMDLIPCICDFLDEPLGDASIVPTYLLSSFAKKHVTVALSGDGADELFAGYPTYPAHILAEYYLKMPAVFRKGLNFLAKKMPVSLDNFSLDFKIKKFISGLEYKPEVRHYNWLGSFSPLQKAQLFCEEFKQCLGCADDFEDIKFHLADCDSNNPLERLLYLDAKLYLQDDILVKVDRASMANALEVRSPFLGVEFVEFAAKLPADFKLHKFKSKFILKKAAEKRLPQKIVNRAKKGFGIPVAKWIKGNLKQFVLDKFNPSKIEKQRIFNYAYIKQLLNEHFAGKKDNRKLIWTLLIFQMWHEKYISRD